MARPAATRPGAAPRAPALTPLLLLPLLLLPLLAGHAQAILNCFTPNMFKFAKPGQQASLGSMYGAGERAGWYPPQQGYGYPPTGAGFAQAGYQPSPMKMLFGPKWKSGSLFGARSPWKTSAFYRPGLGYGSPGTMLGQLPAGGYSIGLPSANQYGQQQQQQPSLGPGAAYAEQLPSSEAGWSMPSLPFSQLALQQSLLNAYDSFNARPGPASPALPASPTADPYAGTKGAGPPVVPLNKLTTSTTKSNVLVADGGYALYDAYLAPGPARANQSYGYAYPDWYSGKQTSLAAGSTYDSPARVAQQLLKHGLKRQRLEQELRLQQQHSQLLNKSASLTLGASSGPKLQTNARFTILDEPRFVGFGTVDTLSNKEARLSCSFNEAIDLGQPPVWVKFSGPYNVSEMVGDKNAPSFNCVSSRCRTQEIDPIKELRYTLDNGPATSTLIIGEPRLADYGIYRCSALTKAINNNPLETVYQVVKF